MNPDERAQMFEKYARRCPACGSPFFYPKLIVRAVRDRKGEIEGYVAPFSCTNCGFCGDLPPFAIGVNNLSPAPRIDYEEDIKVSGEK